MSVDYKNDPDMQSKYVYLPRVGEIATFKIKEVRKVTGGKDRFHFIQRIKEVGDDEIERTFEENLGWHIECDLDDGKILSVSSLCAFNQVFRKHEVNDGDKIEINHKDRGEWLVTKLG